MSLPDPGARFPILPPLVIVAGVAGVTLQYLQDVDRTNPLLYFTVWSVIAATIAQVALLARPGSYRAVWLRDASCVGMIVSGLVYVTVLVPTVGLRASDGPAVWAANALLHVITPALGCLATVWAPRQRRLSTRDLWTWLSLPLTYLMVVGVLGGLSLARAPYDFLLPSVVGLAGVVGSCLAVLLLFLAVGQGIRVLVRRRTDRAVVTAVPEGSRPSFRGR